MRVLLIAPHMDDEVLGAGATLAKHADRGDAVMVCVVANRAYGHRYRASAIRKEEAAMRRAQRILGYQHVRLLNLPDEQLDRGLIDLIVPLERVYREAKPDVVYTCHRGDLHQDHRAVFEASMVVCRPLQSHWPRRVLCYEVPSSTEPAAWLADRPFLPTSYELITPEQLERKLAAMRCYERETRAFPHPRSPEGLTVYARRRGVEIGSEAAEAFMVVREISA